MANTELSNHAVKKRLKKRTENPELPHDVVINILAGLPVRSLFKFKRVCSLWRSTIETPQFAEMQASYCSRHESEDKVLMIGDSASFYIADMNTLSVRKFEPGFELPPEKGGTLKVYSSNGVLLLVNIGQFGRNERMVLWNPATGKHKHIQSPPDSDSYSYSLDYSYFFGFSWYDSCNEFRILNIRSHNRVLVFDSNSNSWKTVDTLPHNLHLTCTQLDSKAFIHGGFHVPALDSDDRYRILSLSPEGKIIRDFGPPSDWNKPRDCGSFILTAKVWEGRLCLQALALIKTSSSYGFEYWNMEEYGKCESWNKVVTLENPGYVLRSLQQNGRQLWHRYSTDGSYIYVKDGDDNDEVKSITSSSRSMLFVGTYTYTPTLLSP